MSRTPTQRPIFNFGRQVSEHGMPDLLEAISGELTASQKGVPLGAVKMDGSISKVWLSVGSSGKDDSNDLSVELDVFVNGVSCLTTKPKIEHVSGEAAQHKTTVETGDTGITKGVVNTAAADFSAGDVLSYDLSLDRTEAPTTEIANPCIVVEVAPNK